MEIFQIILEVLILISVLSWGFLKPYFSEKGKNLATKEDIKEITQKVEEIKTEFYYSAEFRLNFSNEIRTAVIKLYESLSNWRNVLVGVQLTEFYNRDVNAIPTALNLIKDG